MSEKLTCQRNADSNLGNDSWLDSLDPEALLLLACIQFHTGATPAEHLRHLLQDDIDWEQVMRLGQQHRVMPLLYWSLNTACPDVVPRAILDRFKHRFRINRFHNLLLTKELIALLGLFKAHGIVGIPYKGPVLAAHAYGDVSLRQFVDLDILVAEKDLSRAKDILIAHGYKLRTALNAVEESRYLSGDYEYRLVRDDKPSVIGLHWKLAPKYLHFPLDALRVWDHLEWISLVGATVPSLTREDLLLLLCVHGTKDLWERVGWICDIALLIHSHQGMDWGRVVAQATTLRSTRVLLIGVGLAQLLFATTLPRDLLRQIQSDALVQSLVIKIRERLFSLPRDDSLEEEARFLFYLQAREHFQDRLRMYPELMYLRRWLPARDINHAFWQFSSPLSFLHDILWPLHFLGKCGMSLSTRFQQRLTPPCV
jgi:hypothetical protein